MSNETLSMLSDFIARYYQNDGYGFGFYFPEELEKELGPMSKDSAMVFHKLAEWNVKSLRCRYPDFYQEMTGDIEYMSGCDLWQPGKSIQQWHYQILKSLDCYLYQSCGGHCYSLPMYEAIQSLRDKLGGYIAENHPMYGLAKWQ